MPQQDDTLESAHDARPGAPLAPARISLAQISDPRDVTPGLRRQLIDCWIAVTNAGGAAGFPFPPVGDDDVAPVADGLLGRLDARNSRLVIARSGEALAG
ncbi:MULTISPECIES: hypothetical protein [Streptomyces]|uniref:hypothetical protein n=1 Tax=Streptomyces TaxID=1883 RepID=UPI000A3BE29B|nr:hypothetical protein [Streptomyces triculaminicus]